MKSVFTAVAIATLVTSSFATAQPMGRGSGGASPVMMSCRGELDSLCDGQRGMPGVQCLMDNISDLSDPCAEALDTAMSNMQQGHGQGRDGEGQMQMRGQDRMEKGRDNMSGMGKQRMKGREDDDQDDNESDD